MRHNIYLKQEKKVGTTIMIRYKIDIMKELNDKGYNYTRIKKEKLLSAQTLENIKQGKSITLDTLNKVCLMTKLRVEDIIEMTATDEEREKYYQQKLFVNSYWQELTSNKVLLNAIKQAFHSSQRDNKDTKLYPVYSRKTLDIQGFSLFEILSDFAYQ